MWTSSKKASLIFVCILCVFGLRTVTADEPTIILDYRPESGVPQEALDQDKGAMFEGTFHELSDGTIKTVRIR